MGNKAFHFKQFKVEQDRCAMKIGTDAVLLGSLLPLSVKRLSALEIGSGTGVVSLMLAQQYLKLQIKSIEIDIPAQGQCSSNFEHSPWNDRLSSIQGDFLSYEFEEKYDLVFSNPPFFSKSLLSDSEQRNIARHIDEDKFNLWLLKCIELLNPDGLLALIIPSENVDNISSVLENKMILEHNIFIRSFPDSPVIRNILCFRKSDKLGSFGLKSLSIYAEKDVYSEEYKHALKHYLTIF